ncbi:intercellular adhesion molecule 5-like isoform X6 [Catharus ustulatus]|uniref:intercellular adhesion molecule 5-like isoform X6 n=1 Tax=Catharus ustulatus TaxID=91951 RepID=UPI00140ABAE4|nr:intercellular adhesion molecule 5-like isoform X6 [Catharus ustulatus]
MLCRASLEVGGAQVTKEATARLEVLYPPEFPPRGCPSNRTWLRGTLEALSCLATGNPSPTVLCGHHGATVATTEPSLVTDSRAGTYECKATNALGTRSRRVTVRVESEPTMSESGCPARQVWVEGQRWHLECGADGDPAPSTRCEREGGTQDGGTQDGSIQDDGIQYGGTPDGGIQDGGIQYGGTQDGGVQDGSIQDGGIHHGGTYGGTHGGTHDGSTHHDNTQDGGTQDGGIQDGGTQGDTRHGGIQDGGIQYGGTHGDGTYGGTYNGTQDGRTQNGRPHGDTQDGGTHGHIKDGGIHHRDTRDGGTQDGTYGGTHHGGPHGGTQDGHIQDGSAHGHTQGGVAHGHAQDGDTHHRDTQDGDIHGGTYSGTYSGTHDGHTQDGSTHGHTQDGGTHGGTYSDIQDGHTQDGGTHGGTHGDTQDGSAHHRDTQDGVTHGHTQDGGAHHRDTQDGITHGHIQDGGTHSGTHGGTYSGTQDGHTQDGHTQDGGTHSHTQNGGGATPGLRGRVVTRADGGRYVCRATNRHGVATRSVLVTVEYPPALPQLGCPARHRWLEGSPARLSCAATGNPAPSVSCAYRDTRNYRDISNYRDTEPISRHGDVATATLEVANVTLGHAGIVECRASNARGWASRSVSVEVEAPPWAVNIRVLPPPPIPPGSDFSVSCSARGVPEPTLSWDFPPAPNLSWASKNGSVVATGASRDNAGRYRCVARNQHGIGEASVEVTVQGERWLPLLVALVLLGAGTALGSLGALGCFVKSRAGKKGEYNVREAEGICIQLGNK